MLLTLQKRDFPIVYCASICTVPPIILNRYYVPGGRNLFGGQELGAAISVD